MKELVDNIQAATVLLNTFADRFSEELKNNIKNKQVSAKTDTLYVKKDISGASNSLDVIDSNTLKVNGISSFDGSKLPTNKGFIATAIGAFYDTGDKTKMGDAKFNTTMIAPVLNANLVITQMGNELFNRPVSDLTSASSAARPEDQVLHLDLPVVIRDNADIEIKLQFPKGSSVPAEATSVAQLFMLKMWGVSTQRRA